jgi:hypothetical protein
MLTTRIFLAAMSRANLSPAELKKAEQFYFYVDEFQNFANDTFSEILSEARKYALNLVIAHQYVEQMEEQVRAAVFGNVGTTVAFRVGPFDAETLETIFTPEFTKDDLVNLGFAQIYLTLMIDGVGSRPFSAVTIPPIEPPPVSHREEVIDNSRKQFAAPRARIEESIFSELAAAQEAATPAPKKPAQNDRSSSQKPNRDQQRPRPQQGNAPRPQQEHRRPDPEQNKKTAEDLKSILRNMSKPEEKKARQEPPPLKSALSDVLSRSDMKPPAEPKPKEPRSEQPPENSKPKPFEVPEETLQSIFKEPL